MSTIIDGTTGASQIQDETVTEAKIADGAVTAAKLAAGVISTTSVLAATAGASAGAVGTYAFLSASGTTVIPAGSTIAGSDLFYASVTVNTGQPVGTWRVMGYIHSGSTRTPDRTTVCLRIS